MSTLEHESMQNEHASHEHEHHHDHHDHGDAHACSHETSTTVGAFRKTGARGAQAAVSATVAASGVDNTNGATASANEYIDFGASEGFFDARGQLEPMVREELRDRAFSELLSLSLDHHASGLIGHALLDTLEDQGLSVGDFDAVGALTTAALPMACAMVHAASMRGEDLDAFMMDFVFPSIKGPSIAGKHVLMLDAWLSEKSYVQTSSLVTLRNGNELGLDLSIIEHEGAHIVGIAALVGGVDMTEPNIEVVSPVDGSSQVLPFIRVFDEQQLRG